MGSPHHHGQGRWPAAGNEIFEPGWLARPSPASSGSVRRAPASPAELRPAANSWFYLPNHWKILAPLSKTFDFHWISIEIQWKWVVPKSKLVVLRAPWTDFNNFLCLKVSRRTYTRGKKKSFFCRTLTFSDFNIFPWKLFCLKGLVEYCSKTRSFWKNRFWKIPMVPLHLTTFKIWCNFGQIETIQGFKTYYLHCKSNAKWVYGCW